MFLSPLLKEIRTRFHKKGHPSYIYTSSVPALFEKIKETCPRIQALEFYPDNPYGASGSVTLNDRCCNILQSFSNLRSFMSTTYILKPAIFGILGGLPHLESLGIQGGHLEDPVLDKQLSIPADWFEELIDLRLYDVHLQDIQVLWGQSSLVKKLNSALIQTDPTTPPNPSSNGPMDGNAWIELFLTALPRLSPHLSNLTFYMGDEDGTPFQILQDTRDVLHELKLVNFEVRLKKMYGVDSEDEGYEDDGEYEDEYY